MRLTSSIVSGDDVLDVALHQPFEAVANPDHVDPFELGSDRRRADDAVDAGGRPAADENPDVLVMSDGHVGPVTHGTQLKSG